jgi:hypothetical protein
MAGEQACTFLVDGVMASACHQVRVMVKLHDIARQTVC